MIQTGDFENETRKFEWSATLLKTKWKKLLVLYNNWTIVLFEINTKLN